MFVQLPAICAESRRVQLRAPEQGRSGATYKGKPIPPRPTPGGPFEKSPNARFHRNTTCRSHTAQQSITNAHDASAHRLRLSEILDVNFWRDGSRSAARYLYSTLALHCKGTYTRPHDYIRYSTVQYSETGWSAIAGDHDLQT